MNPTTILVTGASDGIGKQTALDLARLGCRVILHGRSAERVQQAHAEIARAVPGAQLETITADLAELRQVRGLAQEAQERFADLNGLINNAGVFLRERRLSADGFELHFAVNHLAAFLLTNLLLERLRSNAPARIVTVSSTLHLNGSLEWDNLQGERKFSGSRAYSNSKLANVLFTVELAERLRGSRLSANTLHPGTVDTKLLRGVFPGLSGISVAEGADTSVWLATSAAVTGVTGQYFEGRQRVACSPLAQDAALRRELWRISAQLCGLEDAEANRS